MKRDIRWRKHMRSKILMLAVAIALGIAAAFFAAQYLSSARAQIAADAEPVRVLVAVRDVPKGTLGSELISGNWVEERDVPRQFLAAGAVSSVTSIAELALSSPMTQGEQVTEARFELASNVGLAYSVPEGFVALSVPDNPSRGVSGFIVPGDYLMAMSSFDSGSLEDAITKVLIKKARVIAVGKQVVGVSDGPPADGETATVATITLAVTPEDAERIVFAQESGSLWFALLSSGTTIIPDTAGEVYPTVLR